MIATCWSHDGNSRVQVDLKIGDRVQWKANGVPGTFDAVVKEFSISGERVRIYLMDREVKRWVKPRFSSIYRDGRRLP